MTEGFAKNKLKNIDRFLRNGRCKVVTYRAFDKSFFYVVVPSILLTAPVQPHKSVLTRHTMKRFNTMCIIYIESTGVVIAYIVKT